MKKIMFYINTIRFGGAERVIVNLANRFSEDEYEVIFITSFETENEYKLNRKINRIVLEREEVNKSFIKKNIMRTLSIRRICKKEKPDILISFMAEPNFRAILATLFLKTKTLISIRNDPNREYPNKLFRIVAKTLYPLASGIVFQTNDAQKWFSKRIQNKSKIILNHVDDKFYNVKSNVQKKNIVAVGRLEEQKNHSLLINAYAKIADEVKEDKLLIYGEGSLKDKLIEQVKNLQIEDKVIFKGASNKIHEEIKDAKVFVLSSNYEGLPNVVMEAMALGLPIVATDCPCGGPKMLIENNKSGILVPIRDKDKMSSAIKKVILNDELANELASNSLKLAKAFEPIEIFEQWRRMVTNIIEN